MKCSLYCERCGNREEELFYCDRGTWYCRRCIAFGRIDANHKPVRPQWEKKRYDLTYHLPYEMTEQQKEAARKTCAFLKQGMHVLIYAATGAGKTELTMDAIVQYLRDGKRVGFAISRRQVVLEIAQRLQEAFPAIKVRPVCEGHTKDIFADLIVCTMHQLYRYPGCFDLLIMDEVDAFPYCGNEVLNKIAMDACCGELLYLTATPDELLQKEVEKGNIQEVTLFQRPHRHPLVIPKVVKAPSVILYFALYRFLLQNIRSHKQTLVFVPTIRLASWCGKCFSAICSCASLSSKSRDRDEILDLFRARKMDVLFATTVLERGITIPDVQVAVLYSEHAVFTAASLIQMIGRTGRKKEHPDGKGLFLCRYETKQQKQCLKELEKMNASLKSGDYHETL